jgi:hypothetical protein
MITINLTKAKILGHEKRRAMRAEEFKPYDELIMKQIPGSSASEAEAKRQEIRQKYVDMQDMIDAAQNTQEIRNALGLQ